MSKKTTPEQKFARIFNLFMNPNANPGERDSAERKMDVWLKSHGKTRGDIQAILAQAAADDAADQPLPPPSDPRDGAPHPFDSSEFNPASLVEGLITKYVWASETVRVIMSLWVPLTHVYTRFAIAPRIALVSEDPESGKSTLRKVVRRLVYRPNRETLGSPAAIERFLAKGPCTILLDELDHLEAAARKRLQKIWNLGHDREDAETSLMEGGKTIYLDGYAPMLAAGIGNFLAPTQESRSFKLEMERYSEATQPERNYNTDLVVEEFNAVYSYHCNWARNVELNPKPSMPGASGRFADDARGLLAVADSCSAEWGRRARKVLTLLLNKQKAEQPKITILRHGIIIFYALGVDVIGSTRFNQELKRLDVSDAKWTRYRGPSGLELAHPIELFEQAALLEKSDIQSKHVRPPGEPQCRGYKLIWFEAALRKYCPAASREHLRLIEPPSD